MRHLVALNMFLSEYFHLVIACFPKERFCYRVEWQLLPRVPSDSWRSQGLWRFDGYPTTPITMWSRKICSTNKQKDCQIGELVVVIVCCAVSLAFE